MNINLVEGATDKTDSGLRAILSGQATLRIFVAIPVVLVETLLYMASPDSVAGRLIALTAGYCMYVAALHVLVRYRTSTPALYLLVATAVLDPIALSAWLVVLGEYSSIIVGFYLFTILGFGFRTGRPLMHLCQLTAVASFLLVFLSVPYWQENPTVWVAMMLPLIAVPMYCSKLLKTLRESRELAERESQAKSELLAKVSHELRTPLTGIISATELLASESTDKAVARRADTILSLSNKLLREINDLLDEAKFAAGAAQLNIEPVDLQQQVDVLRNALEATAVKKGITLFVDLDSGITDWVQADAHQLDRVLLNLASNAVKFTDHGHVRVTVDLLHESETAYQLSFSVADTGIGIPQSFRAEIFHPFAQVEQGADRRFGGTGLGLSLSQQIVTQMGGALQFESEPGKGSRFWFELTLERSAMPDRLTAESSDVVELDAMPAMRLLVVEDNETNLLLLRELLQIDGHDVTTCVNGMDALDVLSEHAFDLLLLDYNLGDMDGGRLLRTYRFGRTDAAPALFLTADTTQQTAASLRESGGAGILYKPITLAKLRAAIRDICSHSNIVKVGLQAPAVLERTTGRQVRPMLAAVAVSPLDQHIIDELKSVSLRPEFFPTLLHEAETDILRCCTQIRDALSGRHYGPVRDAAHALEGVCANVGAVRLLALVRNLMSASRDDLELSSERWLADLSEARLITVAALRKEVADVGIAMSGGGTTSLHLD